IGRFSDHSKVRFAFEEQPKALPEEPLILSNQQCGQHRHPDSAAARRKRPRRRTHDSPPESSPDAPPPRDGKSAIPALVQFECLRDLFSCKTARTHEEDPQERCRGLRPQPEWWPGRTTCQEIRNPHTLAPPGEPSQ